MAEPQCTPEQQRECPLLCGADNIQSVNFPHIERIATMAAKVATVETLRVIGIDTGSPFEMQADFQHLRKWRRIVEKSTIGAIVAFVAMAGSAIWVAMGLKH